MKICIVENELYLAQSIANKLQSHRYETQIYSSIKDALNCDADVFLISSNMPGQDCAPLIEKNRDKIVILMVSYINNDTVGEPLKLGAKDYIVKPFMIEELLRKIEHYHDYQRLKKANEYYRLYIDALFEEVDPELELKKLKLPTLIVSNHRYMVDKVIFAYTQKMGLLPLFLKANDMELFKKIEEAFQETLLCIYEVEKLKSEKRETLFNLIKDKEAICYASSSIETPLPVVELKNSSKIYNTRDILTIDDYVKYIITTYQYKYPDTELSKKLGISRKSLWEKRKKYGIFKKR